MHGYHGLFRPSRGFFRHQFSADYTISTFGFDFRHRQPHNAPARPRTYKEGPLEKVPSAPEGVVADFGFRYMPEVVIEDRGWRLQGPPRAEGMPLYEDRTNRDQTFAIWFLTQLFDYVAGPASRFRPESSAEWSFDTDAYRPA
jgi:hypothetical protein